MTASPNLKAIVLTGTSNRNYSMLEGTGLNTKVMLPVGGMPMVARVIDNIAATRFAPVIYVSTDDPDIKALAAEHPFSVLPAEDRAAYSFIRSLERVPGDGWVLFVSGDHPLLTTEMIEYFIDESMRREAILSVAVVGRETVLAHYPESRRTWFPAKDGSVSGGNMYLVNKARFQADPQILDLIDSNRKNPIKSAIRIIGVVGLIQFFFRMLPIQDVARKAAPVIGCEPLVVKMPWAECCMDVDKESDRVIAEQVLARRAAAQPTRDPAAALNPAR